MRFKRVKKCVDESFIILLNFFEITKPFISIKNTPRVNSEIKAKQFFEDILQIK